ncbi:DUF1116 domain-containing protein [Acuticoccus sp. MNP-M23]|uniref:oxamate carbamoyltransferase subunit AllG family protein n=1 Tax=Acuticoccus sp. MNP-M23 TaxID=3072793 RepID=UPI002815ADC4|nr:DUF1116 domain-containing protein [Acuticoccus sp. MNP-M23]WMS41137.1 DUF1116 domain-containing protein [Acuticoccus sp. MNP-M23]
MSSTATRASHAALCAARPQLARIAPIGELVAHLPPRTLFHAGPPFASLGDVPQPVRNAAAAALAHEGWSEAGWAAIAAQEIHFAPAQDFGIVTPLAFVAGPSMFAVEVTDADGKAPAKVSPLNDGPPAIALRFGRDSADGLALVKSVTDGIGADLAHGLQAPVPLLPLMADALVNGDDLHGNVAAMQAAIRQHFTGLSSESEAYLDAAGQFALNIVMAASALMLAAGDGVADSDMVVACGGNGREVGWKLASGDGWQTAPAQRPEGPHAAGTAPLPAIGDSAVIDALGFGAAALRFAPALRANLPDLPAAFLSPAAHEAYIGRHPSFPDDVALGLDLTRPRKTLGIMLGMVEETGTHGLIGRGVAPWP